MELKSRFLVFGVLFFLGCSSAAQQTDEPGAGLYEQGYRAGTRQNIDTYARNFEGGDFPYFSWSAPIVQYVDVPAQISNGVFIPAHREPVMIAPGEWKSFYSYPIKSQNRRKYESESADVEYGDICVGNFTALPKQFPSRGNPDAGK